MFNELVKLVDESNLEKRLANFFGNFDYEKALDRFYKSDFVAPFKNIVSSFEDKGDHYELALNVAEGATAKNVKVDLEDNVLNVNYSFKSKNASTSTSISETLPEDADADTLTATVENGVLLVSVNKAEEIIEEEDDEEDEDLVNVRINRK